MIFNRDYKRLLKAEQELYTAKGNIIAKIQSVTDFEIHIDDVPGDGWCIGSDISGGPLFMQLKDIIDIVEKNGKFTKDDWDPFN